MIKFFKNIIALIILSYIELTLASFLSKFFIIIPITFLGYSFYIYIIERLKSKIKINASTDLQ